MRIGLGVVLHVKYKDCKEENKIKPYCSHRMGRRGPKTVTLNSRAALAMICTGSHSHLKADSSILRVGEMTSATFKAREREVGAAIECLSGKLPTLHYIAPVDVVVGSEIEVPEIPESLGSISNDLYWLAQPPESRFIYT